jgi:long-chain acyl-CoA synthetase
MEQPARATLNHLGEILTRNAEEVPDRIAVVDPACRFTWSAIDERANRLANALSALGIRRGDRIAFLLRNSHHVLEAAFAAWKLGGLLVPLSYRMAAAELERVVRTCDPSALILLEDFLDLCRTLPLLSDRPSRAIVIGSSGEGTCGYEALLDQSDPSGPDTSVNEEDLACISFTSGTTGFPKGVLWSHGTLLATVPDNPFPGELCRKSRQLVLAPPFVAGSMIQILNGSCNGATLLLRDFEPHTVMQTIEKEKPTLMACAAVMLRMLASLPGVDRYDTSSLKRIYYGGAPIGSREDYRIIRRVFPCEFQQGYGGAETCILISRLDPEDHEEADREQGADKLRSAGRPAPGTRVKLIGPEGQDVPPGGGVGEVAVKAPWVMKGYWDRPEETKMAFDPDGYYLTGDMGAMDREGILTLVDRKDDMIKTGGLNVYPSEVEAILSSHPDVEEAAVIGVPHPKWETAVAAVIRLRAGSRITAPTLRSYCGEKIGSFKIPKAFFFTDSPLPRSALGKVQRKALRKAYAKEAALRWDAEAEKPGCRIPDRDDPLRHCRKCEFQEVCEKFCYKYFE